MTRSTVNGVLLVLILVTAICTTVMGRDHSKPNVDFMPEMAYSIPSDSFASNMVFADGKTLQAPVVGTIARGEMPVYYQPTPEEALRAGTELTNPFQPDNATALERGTKVYAIYCIPCHGPTGAGDGPVARRGYPPPPSLSGDKAMNMKDGQMFHLLTYGQNNMPSYADQVATDDRWKVILYVRDMQTRYLAQQAAAAAAPAAPVVQPAAEPPTPAATGAVQ